MSLAPGQPLGPYEITAPLGAGGMGEVYRARDTKLQRDVAIKVLPAEVARDEERLDDADGKPFLVLELVPGEGLAQRLKRGPIPLDEGWRSSRPTPRACRGSAPST
jgi:serine/threonine protein kinase